LVSTHHQEVEYICLGATAEKIESFGHGRQAKQTISAYDYNEVVQVDSGIREPGFVSTALNNGWRSAMDASD
jgi:hypothetical protein